MKRWFGVILAAAVLAAGGCTDPNAAGLSPVLSGDVLSVSASPTEIVFQEPMSSEEAAEYAQIEIREVQTPVIETPVPVFTATPGPAESFSYSGDTISVRYYDMDTMQAHATQYPVSDASDPQAVLDGVKAAYEGILGNQSVKINDATFSGGNLFVDFDPSIYDLGIGSAGEMQVLESVADTYLTNIDGIKAVFYTVNGEPYNSENISTNANEAFKTVTGVMAAE
ncbi:MAG: GerMN domain-containing protein [Clostridia bacterium]|nr:GerMN domain-containing protein [Clostridia bacterium]